MINSHRFPNQAASDSPMARAPMTRDSADLANILVESAISQLDPGVSYGEIFHTARKIRSLDYGLGPLDSLLSDPTLTDILINAKNEIYSDSGVGLIRQAIDISSFGSTRNFAMTLAMRCGTRLDDAQPWADGILRINEQLSIRFHAMIPPLAYDGACISLRILRAEIAKIRELHANGSIVDSAREILENMVMARKNIIISGATGSGKTTLLQAFISEIPDNERIITLEDSPELPVLHPHHIRLITRKSNTEGLGEIPMQVLVRQSLRMRPDRIFLGEIRGAEISDLLYSFNTGHQGGGATLHANSVQDIPARIIALVSLTNLAEHAVTALLNAVDLIFIHMERITVSQRKLTQIAQFSHGNLQLIWSL